MIRGRLKHDENFPADHKGVASNLSHRVDCDSLFENQSSATDSCEWLTTDEAAVFLRITSATLRNLSSNGRVPYFKWQRRNRYRKEDLIGLLLGSRIGR